jgi:hypothetical protein
MLFGTGYKRNNNVEHPTFNIERSTKKSFCEVLRDVSKVDESKEI